MFNVESVKENIDIKELIKNIDKKEPIEKKYEKLIDK